MRHFRLPALILCALGALAIPSQAFAGQAVIHSCALPDATKIGLPQGSVLGGDLGWRFEGANNNATFDSGTSACTGAASVMPDGDKVVVRTPNAQYQAWTFGVPSGTEISAYTAARASSHAGGGTQPQYRLVEDSTATWPFGGGSTRESCQASGACAGLGSSVTASGLTGVRFLHFVEECLAWPSACDSTAITRVSALAATVRDDNAPTGVLTGPLAGDVVHAPTSDTLAVAANDVGFGLWQSRLYVDGALVQHHDYTYGTPNTCLDEIPGNGAQRDFRSAQPCPPSSSFTFTVNLAGLSEGVHTARIELEDAAGNVSVLGTQINVSRTFNWTIDDGCPANETFGGVCRGKPNGTLPVHKDPLLRDTARITTAWVAGPTTDVKANRLAFGVWKHRDTLRGTLKAKDGTPIARARLMADIYIPRFYQTNAKAFVVKGPRTDSKGRFTWKVPKLAQSRNITFRYRSFSRDRIYHGNGPRMKLRKRVLVTLAAHFSGRVLHADGRIFGYEPKATPGLRRIVIQLRPKSGGRWQTASRDRVSSNGSFHYRLALGSLVRGKLYEIRAISHQSDPLMGSGISANVTARR